MEKNFSIVINLILLLQLHAFIVTEAQNTWINLGVAALGHRIPQTVPQPPTRGQRQAVPRVHQSRGDRQGDIGEAPLLVLDCSGNETEGTKVGLVGRQVEVCRDNPGSLRYVQRGAMLGLLECQYQFRLDRWNCTIGSENDTLIDKIVQLGTRETAFVHATTTAGVVHAVTTACSAGFLPDCACESSDGNSPGDSLRYRNNYNLNQGILDGSYTGVGGTTGNRISRGLPGENWRWGGCSDNIQYGIWFAKTFVDANAEEIKSESKAGSMVYVKALANLHNNEVGRKLMLEMMDMKCRCHGVSGSCAVKTCWKSIPGFRQIGDTLKLKYGNSVEISRSGNPILSHSEKRYRREPIAATDLVHLTKSPNFCRNNPKKGIVGTKDRECRQESNAPDSCHSLCCGRGFTRQEVRHVERCHCKFIWCCQVKCKSCETVIEKFICN